jgi:heptosyltransferase-1
LRTQVQFRLLVVRLGAMGDILHALPAITALRRAHPAWRIGWAVEPKWRALLSALDQVAVSQVDSPRSIPQALPGGFPSKQYGALEIDGGRLHSEVVHRIKPKMPIEGRGWGRPIVDTLHFVSAKAWGRKPLSTETAAGIRALRAELKAEQYDAVLDLQGAIRSSVVARLSGCGRVIGSSKPWEWPARLLYTEPVETAGEHVIEQGIELASAVAGDLLGPMLPWLPIDEDAETWCDTLLDGMPEGRQLVLIHPGAGWGAKRWPADRYGVVAAALADRGITLLVHCGPGEDALAAEVIEASDNSAFVVKPTLDQLIALTRRISLAVGGDTGPVHLACALDRPVVGIYGPTDPSRNGPYGRRVRVLRNPESRRDHRRGSEPEAGLLTIRPDMVIGAALELLEPEEIGSEMGAERR